MEEKERQMYDSPTALAKLRLQQKLCKSTYWFVFYAQREKQLWTASIVLILYLIKTPDLTLLATEIVKFNRKDRWNFCCIIRVKFSWSARQVVQLLIQSKMHNVLEDQWEAVKGEDQLKESLQFEIKADSLSTDLDFETGIMK